MLESAAFVGVVAAIIWVAYLSHKLDDGNFNRKKKWSRDTTLAAPSKPAERHSSSPNS